MKKNNFFTSSDVTDSLIFGKEYEVFDSNGEKRIDLSKGASETKRPLPIVSTLTEWFFGVFQKNPEWFKRENNPDKKIVPVILTGVIQNLRLDASYVAKSNWVLPSPITNEKYLLKYNPNGEEVIFPLTFEIMSLITIVLTSFTQPNNINDQFLSLWSEYFDYQKYLVGIKFPKYLMNQRIENLTFKPITAKAINSEKTEYSFATSCESGVLSLAWAEFYLSQVYEMPVSLCTYCGKVYRLKGKYETSGSCDDENCKKALKKDRDTRKRKEDSETVKEKDRKRQQAFRDKQKAKKLAAEGHSVKEIMEVINKRATERGDEDDIRSIHQIKQWIKG